MITFLNTTLNTTNYLIGNTPKISGHYQQKRTLFDKNGEERMGRETNNHIGGDFVKGDKAKGNINKVEVKGNYEHVGRNKIVAGPFANVNTGTIQKVKVSAGVVFLFLATFTSIGAYCYHRPEQEFCKFLQSKLLNKL